MLKRKYSERGKQANTDKISEYVKCASVFQLCILHTNQLLL